MECIRKHSKTAAVYVVVGGEKQNSGIRTGSSPSFVTSYGTWDSYFSFSKVQFPYLRNGDKSYVIELL